MSEARRLVAQILVGWLINIVPREDEKTLAAIATLLDAMGEDSR